MLKKENYLNKVLQGSALEEDLPRDNKGRFIKGIHYNTETEFKNGRHWRSPKKYWSKEWLYDEYVTKKKSSGVIAHEENCTRNNIIYFLGKHKIKRRDKIQARNLRTDRMFGETNPMYGKRGALCPSWKGGITPLRQELYHSPRWKTICQEVWIRDKRTCQRCNKKAGWRNYKDFHIHHIIPFYFKDHIFDLNNLILLCRECHLWVHSKSNIYRDLIGGDESGIS
jgi:hypothetical protein